MAKKQHKNDIAGQLRLPIPLAGDEQPERAGTLCRRDAVREALKIALSGCVLSREVIAEEMSRLTGESITVHHLNNWTSESKVEWRFPLEYLTAFITVTGDAGVVDAVLCSTRLALMDEETRTYAEYGRMLVEEKRQRKQKAELLKQLGGGLI
jgi:hypothetical protein